MSPTVKSHATDIFAAVHAYYLDRSNVNLQVVWDLIHAGLGLPDPSTLPAHGAPSQAQAKDLLDATKFLLNHFTEFRLREGLEIINDITSNPP